ncbi:uncharacterized protein [Onthophagus taurus]|uniref:uncharacterized protein n=1 Tax=Onthophagus taurus TaxID=166361 RepID=UPI0039BECA51
MAPPQSRNKRKSDDEPEDSKSQRLKTEATDEFEEKERTENEEMILKEPYPTGGIKHTLHGIVYQLKLLMLFVKRGVDLKYDFGLATEMVEAEKFDDIVFRYKDENGYEIYRFVQAKHIQNNNEKKITSSDLLQTEDDKKNNFSLQKYFSSYRKIKQNSNFKGEFKDFVICTNIDLEENVRKNWFKEIADEDNILKFNDNGCKRYNLNIDKVLEHEDLVSKLKNASEIRKLAKTLAEIVFEKETLDLKNKLLQSYHGAMIREKVINVNIHKKKRYATFHNDFLNGNSQKLENLKTAFFEEYSRNKKNVDKDKFWQDVKKEKFKISSKFGEKHTEKDLPDDYYVTDEEIKSFFEKLVFAVNQPDEIELGNIIRHEINDYINLIDNDIVASKFQIHMLDWMKEKEGRFLTHEHGKSFFEEAELEIRTLMLISLTLHYGSKMEHFCIDFCNKPTELTDFLERKSPDRVFNFISSHKTTVSSIKVYLTLKDIGDYKKYDSHIFIRLSSLLRMKERVIEAFKSERLYNLLVIECKVVEKNVDDLFNQLSNVLRSAADNKKIILISQKNDPLLNKIKSNFSKNGYQEKVDERNKLTDLNKSSQKKLLENTEVMFQGANVSLDTLIDESTKPLINGEVLSKLIDGEPIKIGKSPKDLKYKGIQEYYVDRSFSRCEEIKKEEFEDATFDKNSSKFYTIHNNESVESKNLQSKQDIVLISDSTENFEKLCGFKNYEKHHIHWLKKQENKFIWQQSRGDLSTLRKFVNTDTSTVYKPEKFTDIDDKAVIVATAPGMGKSTVLTHLALSLESSLWLVRLNLSNCSRDLQKANEKKIDFNEIEAIKFLCRNAGFQFSEGKEDGETENEKKKREQMIESVLNLITIENDEINLETNEIDGVKLLEIKLFMHFYNRGEVVLLFDGFDEICPDHEKQVIELLQTLKHSKVKKIWVTTRNYVKNQLEEKLYTFSYTLEPLSSEEQANLLKNIWKENLNRDDLDNDRCNNFTNELIKKFSQDINDQETDFLSVPLHTSMVAEIFQDEVSGETFELSKNLDYICIYEKFIVKKFDKIYIEEKMSGVEITNLATKQLIKVGREKFIEDHKILAVDAILAENESMELLLSKEQIKNMSKLKNDIKQGGQRTGIIDKVIDDKPKFVHRTFAEYFVSTLVFEKLKSNYKLWMSLKHIFCDEKHSIIRRFIDSYLKVQANSLTSYWLSVEVNPLDYEKHLLCAVQEGLGNVFSFLLKSEKQNSNYGELISVPRKHIKKLCDNGEYEKANLFPNNALKFLEKELGKNHLEVAIIRRYLGNACGTKAENTKDDIEKTKLFEEKKKYLASALDIFDKHIKVAKETNTITNNNYFQQAVSTFKEDFSIQHVNEWIRVLELEKAKATRNLAVVYGDLHYPEQSKDLLENKAIPIFEKYLKDPIVKEDEKLFITVDVECARAKRNLGNTYGDLKLWQEKIQLLEEALKIDKYLKQPNTNTEELIKSLNVKLFIAEAKRNLGNAYGKSDDHKTKKFYLKQALPVLIEHYGFRSNKVIKAQENLNKAYKNLGLPLHAAVITDDYDGVLKCINKVDPCIQNEIEKILLNLEKMPLNRDSDKYKKIINILKSKSNNK